jgi:tetratricopeptide (TPR) repeat protein
MVEKANKGEPSILFPFRSFARSTVALLAKHIGPKTTIVLLLCSVSACAREPRMWIDPVDIASNQAGMMFYECQRDAAMVPQVPTMPFVSNAGAFNGGFAQGYNIGLAARQAATAREIFEACVRAKGFVEKREADLKVRNDEYLREEQERTKAWEAHEVQATAYVQDGIYDAAIIEFNAMIELKPTWHIAYIYRAGAYERKGEFKRAINDVTTGLRLKAESDTRLRNLIAKYGTGPLDPPNPGTPLPYMIRGRSYWSLGSYNSAVADANKALELDDKNANAYSLRGRANIKIAQWKAAIHDLSEAIAFNFENDEAYFLRGLAYAQDKDFVASINDLEEYVRRSPNDGDGYGLLGSIVRYTAITAGQSADRLVNSETCAPDQKDKSEAIAVLSEDAVFKRSDERGRAIMLGQYLHAAVCPTIAELTLNQLDRLDSSIRYLRMAVRLRPDKADYHLGLALALDDRRHSNDAQEAVQGYRAALALGLMRHQAEAARQRLRALRCILGEDIEQTC